MLYFGAAAGAHGFEHFAHLSVLAEEVVDLLQRCVGDQPGSFRLRLHSGLRQRGGVCDAGFTQGFALGWDVVGPLALRVVMETDSGGCWKWAGAVRAFARMPTSQKSRYGAPGTRFGGESDVVPPPTRDTLVAVDFRT